MVFPEPSVAMSLLRHTLKFVPTKLEFWPSDISLSGFYLPQRLKKSDFIHFYTYANVICTLQSLKACENILL